MNKPSLPSIRSIIICFFALLYIPAPAQVTKISVNPTAHDTGGLTLSELIESIEYVPLQTTDENLIGTIIGTFDISANHIATYCIKSHTVYLFKRNGKFIGPIGSVGGGPGQYLQGVVSGVFIDEERNQIQVHTSHPQRFLIYDLKTRKHKETIPLNFENVGKFNKLSNGGFFMTINNIRGQVPFIYQVRDKNFNLINEQIKSVAYENSGTGSMETVLGYPLVYKYQDSFYARERSLNDTIYSLNSDFLLKPKYILNAGRYGVTTELRGDISNFVNRLPNYTVFWSLYETKDNLLFSYVFQKKDHFDYYSKTAQKSYHLNSKQGIPNDYDGGIDFWPQRQNNNIWYTFYNASLFEERLSEKKLAPKGPQQAVQAFNSMFSKLDPEDNPVLIIVKLKEK